MELGTLFISIYLGVSVLILFVYLILDFADIIQENPKDLIPVVYIAAPLWPLILLVYPIVGLAWCIVWIIKKLRSGKRK